MANLETRPWKSGVSHRIVWRQDGVKQQETFHDETAATRFKQLVEGHGNQWPHGWVKGVGFVDLGPTVEPDPTFGEWATRAIESRASATDRTRADYLRDVELHITPTFGETPLNKITKESVGRWLIDLAGKRAPKNLSPKRIKDIHGLASSILRDAIESGDFQVQRNVFKGAAAKLPDVRTEEMVFLTRQEFDSLLAQIPQHYKPFVLFQYLTGLRWSEATALTVSDIQLLGRRTVTVNKAWKRQPDNTFSLGPPKSRRSRRTISLPAEAVEVLIPLVASRAGRDRLFTSVRGYTMHHGNFLYQIWKPAVLRAKDSSGLDKHPRIHDLRHSHASALIAEGVNLPAIQRRLGHESIQTTIDRYGHLMPESDDQINAALERNAKRSQTPAVTGPASNPSIS